MIKIKKRYIPPYVEFEEEEFFSEILSGSPSHQTEGDGNIEFGGEEEEIEGGSRHAKGFDFILDAEGPDDFEL